jgi:GTP cyclohydrolase I
MDFEKIKELMFLILCEIEGTNDLRDGLKGTPDRIARMYQEIFEGYTQEDSKLMKIFTKTNTGEEVVISRNIKFYSMCEHHMLPFYGTVDIAYLSSKTKIAGISKFARIVDKYSKRLNIQEQMTNDICKFIFESELNPQGVMVVVEGVHMCEVMRGVRKDGLSMITSSAMGKTLEDSKLRNEILLLLNRR